MKMKDQKFIQTKKHWDGFKKVLPVSINNTLICYSAFRQSHAEFTFFLEIPKRLLCMIDVRDFRIEFESSPAVPDGLDSQKLQRWYSDCLDVTEKNKMHILKYFSQYHEAVLLDILKQQYK